MSKVTARVEDIAVYLETVLGNDELANLYPEWPANKILEKTGIKERRIAAEGETAGDMAYEAARNLFAQGHLQRMWTLLFSVRRHQTIFFQQLDAFARPTGYFASSRSAGHKPRLLRLCVWIVTRQRLGRNTGCTLCTATDFRYLF